jgi:2-oxoglutarate ferredoxin oxidoreductase subunit delta
MVCPYDLIEMADFYNAKSYRPAIFVDPNRRCTGCMLCGMICPEAGITVFREIRVRPEVRHPPIPPRLESRR